jgi:hypothetical protein
MLVVHCELLQVSYSGPNIETLPPVAADRCGRQMSKDGRRSIRPPPIQRLDVT